MTELQMRIELLSDATFASGEGVPAMLDVEVDHDDDGFPVIRGKRLSGLLADEGLELLASLHGSQSFSRWCAAHERVFGVPGSGLHGQGGIGVGTAQLPDDLRAGLKFGSGTSRVRSRQEILDACTGIRRQVTIDVKTGAPKRRLLRSSRVVLKTLYFVALIDWTLNKDDADARTWMAATVRLLRRAGLRRNRGRGTLRCTLLEPPQAQAGTWSDVTTKWSTPLIEGLQAEEKRSS